MIFYCAELDEVLLYIGVIDDGERSNWRYTGNAPSMSEIKFMEYLFDSHDWVIVGYL